MASAPVPDRAPPHHASTHWSVSLGHAAGIDVRVHASFVLLVALVAAGSAAPDGPGLLSSMSWLVVLFACVVVHELAHCVVGRSRGAVVHEILLLPIGGMSRMERMPERPEDEFAMAIAGPLASVGLGVAAGAVALAAGIPLVPVSLLTGALVVRLCWVNLLLAGFNLLPAFPLDGGRVLRALLARHHGEVDATRRAARIGRAVAVVMMVGGLFVDVWLTIIGMFVYFADTMEERASLQHLYLRGLHVRDLMHPFPAQSDRPYGPPNPPPTGAIAADDEIEQDLPALAAAPLGTLPVVDHTQVVGVLCLRDIEGWLRERAAAESGRRAC